MEARPGLQQAGQFNSLGWQPDFDPDSERRGVPKRLANLQLPVCPPELDALAPLVDAAAIEFGIEPAYTGRLRTRGDSFEARDDVAAYLVEHGLVLDEGRDGALFVECPWKAGHSSDSGITEAAWFPAGTGGFERGHYRCLHASCAARTDDEFLEAVGCGASADFDALPAIVQPATGVGWALPIIDTTRWIDAEPPEDRWIAPGWLMRGTAALLVGEDGVGKSLLAQQLCTCAAAAKPFLGVEVVQVPSLYITCEDKPEQLWKRQRAINYALGLPIDCAPAALSSLVGHPDVQLGHFDARRVFVPGKALKGIAEHAKLRGFGLIVLDNLAHFFTGNENVRPEVAAFCSALEWLAIEADAAVVLLAHPNKAGAEYSGSTAWSAHVRQRWYMDRPRVEGLPIGDPDARILRKSKANYSSTGDEIAFRWTQWAFRRLEDMEDGEAAHVIATSHATVENEVFLTCLRERNRQERPVSDSKASRTYAPKEFAAMGEAKGTSIAGLEAAMDRLFRLGRIQRGVACRSGRKDREGLVECADLRADPALTPRADVRRPLRADRADTHLPLKGETGAPLEGAAAPSPNDNSEASA
jgi:RecA-family ATPase